MPGAPRKSGARRGRPVIVFAHANGFPAGTYRLLFEAWKNAGFEVLAGKLLAWEKTITTRMP